MRRSQTLRTLVRGAGTLCLAIAAAAAGPMLVAGSTPARVLALRGDADAWAQARAEAEAHIAEIRAHLDARAADIPADTRAVLARTVYHESRVRGLEPSLVLAVMEVESAYDPLAISPKNALGLMQILPSTGRALARRLGLAWHGPDTLFDPVVNTRLGIAYLEQLRDRFGNVHLAIAAYNWGPTRIHAKLDRGDPLPMVYPKRVLDAYSRTLVAPVGAS